MPGLGRIATLFTCMPFSVWNPPPPAGNRERVSEKELQDCKPNALESRLLLPVQKGRLPPFTARWRSCLVDSEGHDTQCQGNKKNIRRAWRARLGDTWIARWVDKRRRTPARLGDKSVARRGERWIGDIGKPEHHQPDWETNELLQGDTNELETSGEPDTTKRQRWENSWKFQADKPLSCLYAPVERVEQVKSPRLPDQFDPSWPVAKSSLGWSIEHGVFPADRIESCFLFHAQYCPVLFWSFLHW